MSATSNVGPAWSIDERLTTADCEAMLRRVCFGHILLARGGHVDVLPIRYAFREGWLLRDRGTGSATGEAAALRGILELRDPTTVVGRPRVTQSTNIDGLSPPRGRDARTRRIRPAPSRGARARCAGLATRSCSCGGTRV